ncbi:hypothetical protein GCM10007216_07270 [Thalassobacillus devorans]|uniref:DUF1641 domain-containing protein n=1 Tax=Thalassobacillus devorans TaxID=279813 RepID=A0ABQ1NKC0_9BACI|nr:DUF1641 domain-containing protein [Thalassobacillus devorans]NIK27638.1 uncharacterized protein YjgD (DUF1641 family) [Thalassobacillus devorans]GGC79330.1 hypothetical protein GCM10007216_07270 [Thalassobacillus devorans]
MAKSMTNIKRMEVPKEVQVDRDMEEIKEAVSENKHAILEGIKLLKALDDADTLQALYALTNHRKDAMRLMAKELNKDQYSGVLENLTGFMFLLGELDVDAIRNLSDRVNRGLEETEKEPESKTGFMDLAKALKDPEINRSVTMLMQFLKGMGRD